MMRAALGPVEKSDSGEQRAIIDGSGEEIGFVEYRVSEGWLEVRWVELTVEHRRAGLGVEAVRLLEVEAERRLGVRGLRAEVPVENGLALYFWLRLGYRPATRGVERGGEVLVMERATDSVDVS